MAARSSRPNRPSPSSNTLRDAFQALHHVRRCLRGIGNLPAFILHQELDSGRIAWWELLEDERRLRPFDFEFLFHVEATRDRYHAHHLATIRRTRKPRIGTLYGFSDLYVPLEVAPDHTIAFVAGQWAPCVPNTAWLSDRWRELAGRRPSDGEPLFRRFVRCCLDVPVISLDDAGQHPALAGLIELARGLGALLSGAEPSAVASSIAKIRASTFLPSRRDENWVPSCTDLDGLVRPPWGLDRFPDPRIVEEMGLSIRPSVIAVLVYASQSKEGAGTRAKQALGAALDELVARRTFQHAVLNHSRAFDDWVAAPLGDAAVILALGRPKRNTGRKTRIDSWFSDRLHGIEEHLRRLGHRCIACLGSEVAPGEPLGQSYRAAVARLERVLSSKGIQNASEDSASPLGEHPLSALVEATRRATTAFELRRFTELRTATNVFGMLVRSVTGGSPEAMTVHIQLLLHGLLDVLERHEHVTSERRRALQTQMCKPWFVRDAASALQHLEHHVDELIGLSETTATADRNARLRLALDWLESHFSHPQVLKQTARRTGLAISSFRREFRRQQGQAFGGWLRRRKLDEAARMLRTTRLSVREIAARVGLGDSHRLIRAFRQEFGTTPERYRRQV